MKAIEPIKLLQAQTELAKVKAQRDALLAACKGVLSHWQLLDDADPSEINTFNKVEAAIAFCDREVE